MRLTLIEFASEFPHPEGVRRNLPEVTPCRSRRNSPHGRASRAVPRAGSGLRPREPLLSGGLRRAEGRGYLHMAVSREFGGAGLTLEEVRSRRDASPSTPPPRRSASTCTTTGWGTRGPLEERRQVLRVDPPGGGRRRSVRRGTCRARQRHPGAPLDHEGRARGGGMALHRAKGVRQFDPGLDAARPSRDGHERPRRAEDRARVPAPWHQGLLGQGDVGRARMRATRSDDTVLEGAFVPTSTSCGSSPRASRAWTPSSSGFSRGPSSGSRTSTTRSASGRGRSSSKRSRRRPRSRSRGP